jgi:hypothetical protein
MVAALMVFVTRSIGEPVRERVTIAAPAIVTPAQSASIDLVRRVARRDLATAASGLARCGGPRPRCAKLPLGRVAFGSRAASGMLGGLANGLPAGGCRTLVLGSGNTLALLGRDADELWRGLGDRSADGRTSSARYASTSGLIGHTRALLGGPKWAACEPPRAGIT